MSRKLTVGSLFAGIGGFDLGFERAGFEIKFQVEIDPYCRAVLAKHWPHVRRYEDVREVHATGLCGERSLCVRCLEPVDVLCGGFPCQDISVAGRGEGLAGARSGLWSEYARLIRELRPGYVVVENVSALLGRGLGDVLGDLAQGGYHAEWDCLPASAFGAPHRRDRVWVIAYPDVYGHERVGVRSIADRSNGALAWRSAGGAFAASSVAADTDRGIVAFGGALGRMGRQASIPRNGDWPITSEPFVCRGVDGLSGRMDRLRGLGNAVVPQIPEWIARRIAEAEGLIA